MEPISLEDITTVQRSVVVHEEDISRLHGKGGNVLFARTLDLLTILQLQRLHRIRIKNLRHTHLRHTTRPSVPQLPSMIMSIIKPHRHPRDGMTIDRRLRRLHSLKTSRLPIALVDHFEIHVELGRDGPCNQSLNALLHHIGKPWWDVQVGNADSDLAIVHFFEKFGVEFGEDGGAVGDEEASSSFGGFFETDEGGVGGGAFGGGFGVEADVVSAEGWLVHLLIKSIPLTGKLPQPTRMQRIQTRIQPKCLVHLSVARNTLHQIKSTEPDRSIL
mmetsp:Transcript_21431/g.38733  ORF Transcript_21431/g.38733 Transcript_21431/m.38733 type:complete len:274 (+) Transcript_21431:254-1075(+)